MNTFTCFPSLPTELRLRIWLHTIPDDQEEVCLPWPGNLPNCQSGYEPHSTLPTLPLTVDTGFPRAMHACREARSLIQNSSVSGVRFRTSRVARCMTPFRRFHPELDVLYLSHDSVGHLRLLYSPETTRISLAEPWTEARRCFEEFIDVLRHTRRLAVHIGLVFTRTFEIHEFARKSISPLESLSLAIPHSSQPRQGTDTALQDEFLPPGKRCRLVPVPATVDPNTLEVTVGDIRERVKKLASAVEESRIMLRECSSVGPRCPGHSPEEKAMFRNIAIDAKVFVEYQQDGSWAEVCAQRMFSGVRHAYSSEHIPMNERSDPELVRVHDTDVEFAPVALEEESEEEWDV